MKRKFTKVRPDGSKEIIEEDDEAPTHHKHELAAQKQGTPPAKQYLDRISDKGQGGDTELAHVNQWEEALLERLGGAGTRNPRTGLKQFYAANAFDLPMDIMPTTVSGSQSTSGLSDKYRDQLMSSLMPQLQSSITNMPSNYNNYTNQALGSYQQMMNNALKQNIPTAISNLTNRGILNSTEGQKVLGNVYSSAATDAATKGYETAMQTALLKANMPTVLSDIAQLGQGTKSSSFSYSQDPTVMYRTMADLIQSMM